MSALWSAPRLDDPWAERSRVSLLRVDPALRDAVAPEDVALAEHALVAPCLRLPRGRWAPEMVAVGGAHPFAALLLDGVVTYEITLAGRRSAQLLGPGDLFRPWASTETSLRYTSSWSASGNAAIALLDDHFLVAARRWPRLANVVYDRLADQMEVGAVRAAIVALPRVEQRVLALFWQLADRWGVVRPDGVVVRLALTHEVIGRLVGAQRPTISLALHTLAEQQLLCRDDTGAWKLARESLAILAGDGRIAASPGGAPG
jgi:CRP/FNR family cyclic AMP-dependent transcriptional regulator